jgi:cytochrome b
VGSAQPVCLRSVWAIPVRIAHWSLAALVLFELFNDSGGKVHRWAGYAAAGVVGLRLVYAVIERSGPARVHLPTPSECWNHLRAMLKGRAVRVAGHNPLGAAMSVLLWSLILCLALSGWISRWDRFWGADWPLEMHAWLSVALQISVALHLTGVAVSSALERQNLVRAMVTGKKYVDR